MWETAVEKRSKEGKKNGERERGRESGGTWSGPLHAESNEFGEKKMIYGDMFASTQESVDGASCLSPTKSHTTPTILSLYFILFFIIISFLFFKSFLAMLQFRQLLVLYIYLFFILSIRSLLLN